MARASEREPLDLGEGAKAAIRAYVTQAPTTHVAEGTVQGEFALLGAVVLPARHGCSVRKMQ